MTAYNLTHLNQLEAESIHIIREVAAAFENPVMLYSIGKDSSVMLHLARKAFYPGRLPFPLLHVDTTWKFREMIAFRDAQAKKLGLDLIVHINEEGIKADINPFDHGSEKHTDIMKTQALKQALNKHRFDAAFGGRAPGRGKVARQGTRIFLPRQQSRLGPAQPAARAMEPVQHAYRQGRKHPGIPAFELDRTRCLAVHLSERHRHRTPVFRQATAGSQCRRR